MASRNRLYRKSNWLREVPVAESSSLAAEPYRHPVRRDYARLIHSPAFRRLQGKTQLFPAHENDFFRNRLTHSLEVAQVAKSIASRLNFEEDLFQKNPINLDLVEFAALAHDLGHPPFGHNGEEALDNLMRGSGGFEGNAQTLRILSRLEKKETESFPSRTPVPDPIVGGVDRRCGLNLTYRSLASVLKYDRPIPKTKAERSKADTEAGPSKGYYRSESSLVSRIKKNVASQEIKDFRTIECSIMDISDDICYSTYDIEDSFKAGFLSPVSLIAASDTIKAEIADTVSKRLRKMYPDKGESEKQFTIGNIDDIFHEMFGDLLEVPLDQDRLTKGIELSELAYVLTSSAVASSIKLGSSGYFRSAFTSELVGRFIRSVELIPNNKAPQLSIARLNMNVFKVVETLKAFAFNNLIDSPRLKLTEKRGHEIIGKLFKSFCDNSSLLPEDWRNVFNDVDDGDWRKRVVCDYISSMTDRYCVEMYDRLAGTQPMTIYKPH
ncbi:MAG: dNTP triphosphohydrolase [Gammaproteobacteria bacterium]|nr:dNTP triphosphohydrolase [Gammaproteobacteria bacterium]